MGTQRFSPTDGGPEFVWDGTLWRPALGTTLGYEPPSTGWTAINGGNGANLTFDNGVLELTSTQASSTPAWSLAARTIDGSGSFDARARVRSIYSPRNSTGGQGNLFSGIFLRNSSNGNMQLLTRNAIGISADKTEIMVETYSNATTWIATQVKQTVTGFPNDAACWFRVQDTSPTWRTYYISNDGRRWWEIYKVAYASRYPTTVDQVGHIHMGMTPSGTAAWDSGALLESLRIT